MKYIYVLAVVVFGATLTRAQTVTVWLTTHDLSTKLAQEASVSFATTNGGSNPVWVDETQTYQQIEGFGASFTDSAAYLLKQVAIPRRPQQRHEQPVHAQRWRHRRKFHSQSHGRV